MHEDQAQHGELQDEKDSHKSARVIMRFQCCSVWTAFNVGFVERKWLCSLFEYVCVCVCVCRKAVGR